MTGDEHTPIFELGALHVKVGMEVELVEEEDSIVPAGKYVVSATNADGSFHVGGNTAVWPRRIKQ